MQWVVAALLFAVFQSFTMLINQHYRVNGHLISGMRGLGVALAFLPAVFFVPVPCDGWFWALVVAQGCMSSFFNARLYASSAIYGAGSTSRISLLCVPVGVVLWWPFDPARFEALLSHPWIFSGLLGALAAVCVGFFYMARSHAKRAHKGELLYLLPAVVVLAFMMINRKEIMMTGDFFSAAVYYSVCAISMSGAFNLLYYLRRHGVGGLAQKMKIPRVRHAGLWMVLASGTTIFFGNWASATVPNPAYVTAMTLISPLLIMAINHKAGVRDTVSYGAVALLFAGLLALIYLANLPLEPPHL